MAIYDVTAGTVQVTWSDYKAFTLPATSLPKVTITAQKRFGTTYYQMQPVPQHIKTWSGFCTMQGEGFGASASAYYALGGNDRTATLNCFGARATLASNTYHTGTSSSTVKNDINLWMTMPAEGFSSTGSNPATDQTIEGDRLPVPVLHIPADLWTSATSQFTTNVATLSAKTTTTGWLEANNDWWWIDSLYAVQAHPIVQSSHAAYYWYPHTKADADDPDEHMGMMAMALTRSATEYPCWFKWNDHIVKGMDRGNSHSGTYSQPYQIDPGLLTIMVGSTSANSGSRRQVRFFGQYFRIDNEAPVTTTAELKAVGINGSIQTHYGIAGLFDFGSAAYGSGLDGSVTVGPGAANWYGQYPSQARSPISPATWTAAGVTAGAGFRLKVVAWDTDNGSPGLPGNEPDPDTETFTDLADMIANGFIQVCDVEFWPENEIGPLLDWRPLLGELDVATTPALQTRLKMTVSVDGGPP